MDMNSEEFKRLLEGDIGDLRDAAIDNMAEYAEKWSGDTRTDRLARGIIAAQRPVLEALADAIESGESGKDDRGANPLVFQLIVRQSMQTQQNIAALNSLAELRGS